MKRLLLILMFMPVLAYPAPSLTTTEVLVLASAATQLPQTRGRVAILVTNLGPNAIFCAGSSATAVVNKAHRVGPLSETGNNTWAVDLKRQGAVWCIAASADQLTGAATVVTELTD